MHFFDLKYQYQLSLLIIAISTALLGGFAVLKSKRNKVTFYYFVWTSCIALWASSLFASTLCHSHGMSKLWSHALHFFAILLPVVYLQFIYSFGGGELTKGEKKTLRVLYALAAALALINLTPGFVDVEYVEKFGFFVTRPRILYPIHMVQFIGIILFATCVLYLRYKKDTTQKKNQYLLLFIGAGVGYSGGLTNYLINYNISLFPLYPFGNYTIFIYVVMIAFAIIRYRFLDIDVIIRRTVVFAGLLTFVFGAFSAATFLVQEVLAQLGLGKTWTYAISLFVIVLGYDPIRNFLVNLTDKYLFQKKYDYQKLLKDATRGMSKIESLHHLLGLVVHFITMKMRVKNTAIMMRRRDNEFELGFQRGYSRNFLDYRLDDTNPMIMYLMREKEALDMEQVKEFIEAGNKKIVKGEKVPHEYDFQAIHLTMAELEAACVVPSFLGHELRSILLVGEKKSGHFFTPDDVTLLFTLAQESAIAIENAKLFDEAINKSNQLAKINEQLEYSRNLLMKALRETEIANKQLQDTQAQLIHEQKMATLGRLAASVGHEVNNPLTILSMNVSRAILKYRKNPDLKVAEVLELFQKMEQNIGRIKAVVNTLTGLLKKSEKGKFEPLSLKLILEETLPLVQFQTYLDNLSGTEVEFDIPGNTPLIRGDLERLQEVFLNLFINAYHAMQGRRNRRIRVTAELDPENNTRVAVNFNDNGCGMTEEIMKKIFNYGFTTKPPGRGSGMGLYMCKYIVELHGGDMKVGSKVGEGTTFTIYLPAYEEGAGEAGGLRIEQA